jgi:putative oxidoreductase
MAIAWYDAGAAQATGDAGLALLFLIGRILFSAIFIMSGFNHLKNLGPLAQYAASSGVPAPRASVVISGLMILAGGLSILLGVAVRAGMILLVLFLLPAGFMIHRFWGLPDPAAAQNQQAHFMKNLAMAGAALMIYYLATVSPDAWVWSFGR